MRQHVEKYLVTIPVEVVNVFVDNHLMITTYSIIAISICCILPFILTGYAKISTPGYSNVKTRDSIAKLTGKGLRAHYAHLNAFESLPLFIAAVIIANINQVEQSTMHTIITIYVLLRIIYGFLYIFNFATSRSIIWMFALACNFSLLYLST